MPSERTWLSCDHVSAMLPGIVDGGEVADLAVRRHVEGCLRCQAETVQYRRILKARHNLRTEVLEPAPGLVSEVLAHVEAAGERGAVRSMLSGHRGAYLGGLAAATAAGAGALVLATRARHRRVPLAG